MVCKIRGKIIYVPEYNEFVVVDEEGVNHYLSSILEKFGNGEAEIIIDEREKELILRVVK